MDTATAGLIGAGIGGAVSITTALVAPWVSSRWAMQQFAREAEQEKRRGLETVLEEAGLALEEAHWSVRHALTVIAEAADYSGSIGEKEWRAAYGRMEDARASASSAGTRLAVRLGGPAKSRCVARYNDIQLGYRQLLGKVMDAGFVDKAGAGFVGELDTQKIDRELKRLGADERFQNEASKLLTPVTAQGADEQPVAQGEGRGP